MAQHGASTAHDGVRKASNTDLSIRVMMSTECAVHVCRIRARASLQPAWPRARAAILPSRRPCCSCRRVVTYLCDARARVQGLLQSCQKL